MRRIGYETWLDEHEMIAGDALSSRIAEGVRDAKVVLVVVSIGSAQSKWLHYELNLATNRMVKGECRVIPAVVDDVTLPAEVLGLLYADFRSAFKHGMRSIRTALEYENTRAESLAAFWIVARELVRKVFDGVGHIALDGEYAGRDYDIVEVEVLAGKDTKPPRRVFFESISSHRHPAKALDERWWSEFCSSVNELPEALFLVVTERPIAFTVIRPDQSAPAVSYRQLPHGSTREREYAVFVDLSGVSRTDWEPVVVRAKRLLSELADRAVGKRQKRKWAEMLMIKKHRP